MPWSTPRTHPIVLWEDGCASPSSCASLHFTSSSPVSGWSRNILQQKHAAPCQEEHPQDDGDKSERDDASSTSSPAILPPWTLEAEDSLKLELPLNLRTYGRSSKRVGAPCRPLLDDPKQMNTDPFSIFSFSEEKEKHNDRSESSRKHPNTRARATKRKKARPASSARIRRRQRREEGPLSFPTPNAIARLRIQLARRHRDLKAVVRSIV